MNTYCLLIEDHWQRLTFDEVRELVPEEVSDKLLRGRLGKMHTLDKLSQPLHDGSPKESSQFRFCRKTPK